MVNVQKIKGWSYLKVSIIYVTLCAVSITIGYILLNSESVDSSDLDALVEKVGINVFLFLIIPLMAVLEEVAFRFIPIYILVKYFEKYTIPVMVIVSCLFGYLHGGWEHVLIQGFGGIGLSLMYIKGLSVNHPFALTITSITHTIFNFTICYLHY